MDRISNAFGHVSSLFAANEMLLASLLRTAINPFQNDRVVAGILGSKGTTNWSRFCCLLCSLEEKTTVSCPYRNAVTPRFSFDQPTGSRPSFTSLSRSDTVP